MKSSEAAHKPNVSKSWQLTARKFITQGEREDKSPDMTTAFSHFYRVSEGKLMLFDDAVIRNKSDAITHRQTFQGNLNLRKILQRKTYVSKSTQAITQERQDFKGKKEYSLHESKLMS